MYQEPFIYTLTQSFLFQDSALRRQLEIFCGYLLLGNKSSKMYLLKTTATHTLLTNDLGKALQGWLIAAPCNISWGRWAGRSTAKAGQLGPVVK